MGPMVQRAIQYRTSLLKVKNKGGVAWYPYDSLANVTHMEDLLGNDSFARLKSLAGSGPVLDIGCGDGDLSFFLEHLGYPVHAVDNPVTNHNGMKGIAALKERLKSRVEISSIDIDEDFRLASRYRLAIFFGILYHLKNPYYVLERMARSCEYMFLSTRIASGIPRLAGTVEDIPIAYLVGDDELNNDNSNYWILTKACLLRILTRTQWRVEEMRTMKLTSRSDPNTTANDERAFLLLRSTYGGLSQVELLDGWHAPENEGWRWTERRFSLAVHSAPASRLKLSMRLFVPDAIAKAKKKVTLKASVNGISLGEEKYAGGGEHSYVRPLTVTQSPMVVQFDLNHALPPEPHDMRERGVIVVGCEVDAV